MVNENNQIHCSLVIAKARVFPLKYVYTALLGLTAVTLSVKISELLKEDLDIKVSKELCGSDSQVDLTYIKS